MVRDIRFASFVLTVTTACGRAAPPPDVLLVTLDTTRADAVGAYGAIPSPTPTIDTLAAAGLRAAEAMTVTPLTLPAHTSILTGRTPDHHGVRDNTDGFAPPTEVTLAERLHDAGWQTGAFVGAIVLEQSFGLDQGFDAYDDGYDLSGLQPPAPGVLSRPGDAVSARAIAWLATTDDRPRFVWLHLYDPHQPLRPPPEQVEAFGGDLYAAAVAHADAQIAAVLAALRPDPLVVVVADHGEGHGEHGEDTHGTFVYRSTMRVPLVVSGPGFSPSVVADPVSVVDVAPTVLAALGLPPLPDVDGQSLLTPRSGPVYGESWFGRNHFGHAELRVLQDDTWRYVLAPRPELYAWKADPDEVRDVVADHPDVAAAMRAAIEARAGVASPGSPVDPRTRAALAALGYVGGTAADPAASFEDLPDPKDHPEMVRVLEALIVSARTRPPADAVPLIEAFLVDNPQVPAARHLLATALERAGRPNEALVALEPLGAGDAVLAGRRAELLLAAGREEEALVELHAAREKQPSYVIPWAVEAELFRRRGDCATALALVDEGMRVATGTVALRTVRGACLEAAGDDAGALAEYRAVVAEAPGDPNASELLVRLLGRTGHPAEALPVAVAWWEAFPADERAALAVGMTRYELGDFAGAVDALAAVALRPDAGPHGLLALADAQLRLGAAPADVHRLVDEAARRGARPEHVHRLRSAVYMAEGRTVDALAEMEAAVSPAPSSP